MQIIIGDVRRTAAITFSLAADEAGVIEKCLARGANAGTQGQTESELINVVRSELAKLRVTLEKDAEPKPKTVYRDHPATQQD